MKYFRKINNLPIDPLLFSTINSLLYQNNTSIEFDSLKNQICINSIPGKEHDIFYGVNSLDKDWDNAFYEIDEKQERKIVVPFRTVSLSEYDFTEICTLFKNTRIETIIDDVKKKYNIGRCRVMKLPPKQCLTWHCDYSPRLHYVLKTQPECFMVVEDEVKHLPQDTWWLVDTTKFHTVFNGSLQNRYHLVFSVND